MVTITERHAGGFKHMYISPLTYEMEGRFENRHADCYE